MRSSSTHRFALHSWIIVLLIGLAFFGLVLGLRSEILKVNATDPPSWLDLALLLGAYLFMFCIRPMQRTVQRKLCQRASQRSQQKTTG